MNTGKDNVLIPFDNSSMIPCVRCILQVNAYGFGGSYAKFSDHYYDKTYERRKDYLNHDNHAENALWQRLHNLGVINLYHRDN